MANNPDASPQASGGALLSTQQREWLREGGQDPDTPANRSKRIRIRERLAQSFVDFTLLSNLPEEDIKRVFQGSARLQAQGMTAALSFIYRGTRHGLWERGDSSENFEVMLKRAIRNAEFEPDDPLSFPHGIDVVFEDDKIVVHKQPIENVDLETIGEKIADNNFEDLSRSELAWFISFYQQEGALDPQYPARVRERVHDLSGEKLSPEEAEKRRNQVANEFFADRGDVEELRETAEEFAEERQTESDEANENDTNGD